jgi:hypothetical protein
MIHVDLDSLKQVWYNFGSNSQVLSADNKALFNGLDSWQRKELLDAYNKGQSDKMVSWKA